MSKGLEALKHLYAKLSCKSSIEEIDENLQEYETIVKELDILETIKDKQVDIWLICNSDYDNYIRIRDACLIDSNIYCDDGAVIDYKLTRKEFGLIKEWLEHE